MQHISFTTVPVDALETTLRKIIRSELESARTAEQNDRLISPGEACRLFSPPISKTTLAKWTKEGLLQDQRVGGRVYYRYGDILNAGKSLKRYSRNTYNLN